MAISDNVREVSEKIDDEVNANPPDANGLRSTTAKEIHTLATNAILGGMQEWVAYMSKFAKTPEELARLIPIDGSTDDKHRSARAYLVANGMCTDETTPHMQMRVTNELDL
jgi:hypothetical protein